MKLEKLSVHPEFDNLLGKLRLQKRGTGKSPKISIHQVDNSKPSIARKWHIFKVVSTQPPKVVCSIFPTLIVLVSLNSHWSKWLLMVLTSWLVLKRDSKPAKTSMPISKVANKNKPQTQDDATEKIIDQWNCSKIIFHFERFHWPIKIWNKKFLSQINLCNFHLYYCRNQNLYIAWALSH